MTDAKPRAPVSYAMVQEALMSIPQGAAMREHVRTGWRPVWLESRSPLPMEWTLLMEYPDHGDKVRILPNGAAVYCFPWRQDRK